jgi:hypothetical protein
LIAIDPGELTAPVRVSHSRKQQKKFLEGKTFDRAVDGQSSAGGAASRHHHRRIVVIVPDRVQAADGRI